MTLKPRITLLLIAASIGAVVLVSSCSSGDSNNSRSASPCAELVCVETVNVADVGNPADTDTGFGSVGYGFAIGKYEIDVTQYTAFLNAVAKVSDVPAIEQLWNSEMEKPYGYVSPGLIARSGSGTTADPYSYAVITDPALGAKSGQRSILNISWFSAARFANWMHNGATDDASTETGAYALNGATKGVFLKNADAKWWIPSEDEWYKAAYYDPTRSGANKYWQYPTRSDELPAATTPPGNSNAANYDGSMSDGLKITPVGAYTTSVSYYGTFDQAGLLWEWNDKTVSDHDGNPVTRGMRGGSWSLGIINISKYGPRDYEPTYDDDDTGFRLATTVR